MGRVKDITGQKFDRLTVIKYLYTSKYHKAVWLCKCDCGNFYKANTGNLTSGNTKSCGCLVKEGNNKSHGKTNTKLYNVWCAMKQRCYYENDKRYKNYGGRGIAVCSEWLNDFMAFYKWSIDNGYRDNLTIDRIDVDGNYEPNNCRWITMKQQLRNTTRNRYYTINSVTMCLKDWCEKYNLNYMKVYNRLKRGWNIERALEL